MLPAPAQYLLRIDDLCPTVHAIRWRALQSLIEEFRLKPILAIVPDNCDPELSHSPPNPEFWPQMLALESAGASIGLHGYRHLCVSRGRSLVPINRMSEFAGVPIETQQAWISEGLTIIRAHGLNPRLWVAPRHGFDRNTLHALREQGIEILSDGFARIPFTRAGLTWISQQIWEPVEKRKGLWTICIHPGTMTDEHFARLRTFLTTHAEQFTSVDRILRELPPKPLGITERIWEASTLARMRVSRLRNHFAKSR